MAIPSPPEAPEDEHRWVRLVVGWHLAFWLLLSVITAGLLLGSTFGFQVDPARRGAALAVVTVLAVAYATLGHRAAVEPRGTWRGTTYVATLVTCVVALLALVPSTSFVLFLAYPQIWFFSERRRIGVLWTVLVSAGAALAFAADDGFSAQALREDGVQMAVSMSFSLVLGLWVASVIGQSGDRAAMVAELREARAALAEADHGRGVMAERERLAGEIHDTLAQGFTSVVVLAQGAATAVGDDEAVRSRLATIEAVARENLAEARALVAAFAPVALDGSSLRDALGRLVERFAAETGVAVRLEDELGAPDGLSRDAEVVLLRAVQEALANVRRHAGASSVVVRVGGDGVEVRDDGAGFTPQGADGFGLDGMRRRVEQVGGRLEVDSAPGRGTSVRVRLP